MDNFDPTCLEGKLIEIKVTYKKADKLIYLIKECVKTRLGIKRDIIYEYDAYDVINKSKDVIAFSEDEIHDFLKTKKLSRAFLKFKLLS